MIETLLWLAFGCLVVIAGAVGLVLALRFGRAATDAIPMSRAGRSLVERLRPVIATTLIAAYAVIAARWLLEGADFRAQLAIGGATFAVIAASWGSLRDALEGVYLRAGRSLAIGDRVRIGDVRGRVQRFGYRAVVIETSDGELAIVPYRAAATTTILREPTDEHSSFHVFRVQIPEDRAIADVKRLVREAALLSHWSSVARAPEVATTGDGQLEITIFPLDADHGTDLERAVRRALTP